jgi:hypothetical protein
MSPSGSVYLTGVSPKPEIWTKIDAESAEFAVYWVIFIHRKGLFSPLLIRTSTVFIPVLTLSPLLLSGKNDIKPLHIRPTYRLI